VVTPAAIYIREDGTLVTGEAASLRAVSNPDRVSREFKRRLGNPTPVMLGGQSYTVTALLGTLLRDVIEKVVETEGERPERVLLTHPANWGPFRRALFEEVPQYAGLDNPPMVTEPEAAAAHYAASRLLADGQTVAVYDLGGEPSTPPSSANNPAAWRSWAPRRASNGSAESISTKRCCPTSTTPPMERSTNWIWEIRRRESRWPGCVRTAYWPRKRFRRTPKR
jgi:hypothetical protein